MKFPFIIFSLWALMLQNSSFEAQDVDFILGEWKICTDAQSGTPPFLYCRHNIKFEESGNYSLLDGNRVVGSGSFKFIKCQNDERELYLINFLEDVGLDMGISNYVPNKSLLFLSDGKVFFVNSEDQKPSTPFFLYKP